MAVMWVKIYFTNKPCLVLKKDWYENIIGIRNDRFAPNIKKDAIAGFNLKESKTALKPI